MKTTIAIALAALALSGCMSAEKQEAQARDFTRSESLLDTAQRNASVACADQTQCDKAWSLTKDYVAAHSSTSIVRADAAAIETDVPSRSGKAVYSATRVAKGSGATITLYAQCRGMYGQDRAMGSDYDDCVEQIGPTQNGFVPFLNQHLSSQ
ncbi:hypothetical protein PQR05_29035 [Paraburkholderia sediminicola]|uniref:Lipoprotein n=1 Tax=Paraburkholderia metrosideri TaxID=580937 RepID=A0ABW9E075_9BURK